MFVWPLYRRLDLKPRASHLFYLFFFENTRDNLTSVGVAILSMIINEPEVFIMYERQTFLILYSLWVIIEITYISTLLFSAASVSFYANLGL